jgi:hypothetical protein
MALSASTLASLIESNLTAIGAKGSNLHKFCSAVAAGIVMSIVGKAFVTADVGLVAGVGTGIGIGIQGLISSSMKSEALSLMSSQGKNAEPLMRAIVDATVSHLSSSASLSSIDTSVFSGVGTIIVGSIAVVPNEMGQNIDSQLQNVGAIGSNRTNLSNAIGIAIAKGILSSGTGTLIITGVVISGPSPGAGSGTGTVS